MKNLLKICFVSIDIEADGGAGKTFRGGDKLESILKIFEKYNVSATFFVSGEVLERYPELVKRWSEKYEIASHSFSHRFWNTLNQKEREKELDRFIELYQSLFQKKPLGFRAPSHIIDEEGIKLLEEKGFLYDSSVVPHYPPFKKYRGYRGKAPLLPHYPLGKRILEIPIRGQVLGIPLAGAWLRGLSVWVYKILFSLYSPEFIVLSMHCWDALDLKFSGKLEKIFKILKEENYQFLNGGEIAEKRK